MKTLDKILKQDPVFLNSWSSKIDVISDFTDIGINEKEYKAEIAPYANTEHWLNSKRLMTEAIEKQKDINILFASYGEDNYSGDAFVLFTQYDELYEVNAGHCSCYGLENQFSPELTSLEALEHRLISGKIGRDGYSGNEFADQLKIFIGI